MVSRRRSQGGFTLIELMVVVLVIGILMAIAIPTFLGATSRSEDVVAKASLRIVIKSAIARVSAGDLDDIDFSPKGMKQLEPALDYVDGTEASTGPKVISFGMNDEGTGAGIAALSESGTCFMVFATGDEYGPKQYYASSNTKDCTATRAAVEATKADW